MTEHQQNRLLGIQLLAVLLAVVGTALGSTAVLALGIGGFFLTLAALSLTVTGELVTGVERWTRGRATFLGSE